MAIKPIAYVALSLLSSTAGASLDTGANPATSRGGEMVLALWDDRQGKAMLFDTGINFGQVRSNEWFSFNLSNANPNYKSFFNYDFSNVRWNAYVGNDWNNGERFDNPSEIGAIFTTQNPELFINSPLNYQNLSNFIISSGDTLGHWVARFETSDPSISINQTYESTSSEGSNYLGSIWGNSQGGYMQNTSAKAGDFITLVFNGITGFDYTDGVAKSLGRVQFNPITSTFGYVPIPAASWLLISGMLGLGAIVRRRHNLH
ncbi:MAG: VPLPA-CTERM sorting domain-containing protein [Marinagarivorans sp.]